MSEFSTALTRKDQERLAESPWLQVYELSKSIVLSGDIRSNPIALKIFKQMPYPMRAALLKAQMERDDSGFGNKIHRLCEGYIQWLLDGDAYEELGESVCPGAKAERETLRDEIFSTYATYLEDGTS